jgi:hypothetical protein
VSDIALTYNFQHKSCPLILTISVYEIKGKMYKLLKGDFNQIILLYNYINYVTKQKKCICYNKNSFFFYFQRIMIAYIVRFLQIPPSYFNSVFAVWTKFTILFKGSFFCSVYLKQNQDIFFHK